MGLKAYPSIADLPTPADLAILIIPAQHVPAELERCGKAGVRSAVVLSSGFAEAVGGDGAGLQDEMRAIAKRYGMAVMGPNSEGFANTAAALCPTFSPAVEPSERPLLPQGRERGQLAVIAQSGGIGFSFFDHGRAKELAFRYVVTTGNEACLDTLDFADFILDEGKVSALLMLLEDVKSPDSFRRVAEKALKAGVPIIVNKIGQSEAGMRAAASHTAALAGSYDAHRAMFQRYGLIEGRDLGEMVDIAAGFVAFGSRLPAGKRVGICTASGGGGGWMADACTAAGLEVPQLDAATRAKIDVHLPAYGTSQNPVDATAQALHKIGYAGLARFVVESPSVDSVIVVMTARNAANLERQREAMTQLAAETAQAHPAVELHAAGAGVGEAPERSRLPAFHRHSKLRPHDARDGRLPGAARAVPAPDRGARAVRCGSRRCAKGARGSRPDALRVGGAADPGGLRHRIEQTRASWRTARMLRWLRREKIGGAVALKVQSPDIVHKTEAGAVALNLVGADAVRTAYARVLGNALRAVPNARVLGVLVQPMAAPGREVILGVKRDATFGPMLMVGLGGVQRGGVQGRGAGAAAAERRRRARHAGPAQGRAAAGTIPRPAGGGRGRARRPDGASRPIRRPIMPRPSPKSI